MATERIAAKYVYTLEDERPMVDAYVEYDTDTSAIVSVGKTSEGDHSSRLCQCELPRGTVTSEGQVP